VAVTDVRDQIDKGFRPVADQKQLGFTVEVQPGAPARIVTDGQRLHQVLKNLLSNAFKFTHQGHVSLTIRSAERGRRFANASLDNANSVIAFAVGDTGIGIAKDKQRLIFESFQQADGATSRKYGGTGLGLSISREIARLLGGEIRVESTPGVGSTFTLFLPDTFVDMSGGGTPAGRESGIGNRESGIGNRENGGNSRARTVSSLRREPASWRRRSHLTRSRTIVQRPKLPARLWSKTPKSNRRPTPTSGPLFQPIPDSRFPIPDAMIARPSNLRTGWCSLSRTISTSRACCWRWPGKRDSWD
jgi:two-component sensor histidine kinase